MLRSSFPLLQFNIPFANSASGSFIRAIPQASQIGIQNGAASLTDGFPPLNFQPVAAGGVPPFGSDMNGILNQLSLWVRWFEAGGPIFYDAVFATGGSGGYPNGARLNSSVSPGQYWMSTADNNTTDPDSVSSANWVPAPGSIASGTPMPSFSSTVPNGYVASNANTIGNASSNATNRANADTLLAYRSIWTNFSNTACPIFTSAGAGTSRGANADADFAANKALSTPDMRGRGMSGVDTMNGGATTRLASVPVGSGSTTAPGSVIGENLHALITAELALHTHANTLTDNSHTHSYGFLTTSNITGGGSFPAGSGTTPASTSGPSVTPMSINNASVGSGTAHNNVPLNMTVFWNIKL